MTVTTIYAESSDGLVSSFGGTSWADTRSGAGTVTAGVDSAGDVRTDLLYIGGRTSGGNLSVSQSFLEFDTSSIPDADPITVAVASIRYSGATGFTQDAQLRTRDWGGTVTAADWVPGNDLSGLTLLASASPSFSVGYVNFTESGSNLRDAINKTGSTRMVFHGSELLNAASPPGTSNWFSWWAAAETSGTSQDPKLTITHGGTTHSAAATIQVAADMEATASIDRLIAATVEVPVTSAGQAVKKIQGLAATIQAGVNLQATLTHKLKGLAARVQTAVNLQATAKVFHPGVGSRPSNAPPTFGMEVLTSTGDYLYDIHPYEGAQVTCQAGAKITRTLTGVLIPEDEIDQFNPVTQLLRPYALVDGVRESLGVFVATTPTRHHRRQGDLLEIQGHDLGSRIADTTMPTCIGFPANTANHDIVIALLAEAGIYDAEVEEGIAVTGEPLAWCVGDKWVDAIRWATVAAGLAWPWVDRHGTAQSGRLPYAGDDEPTLVLSEGKASIIADGAVETSDTWEQPTSWTVVSRSETQVVFGTYDLPNSHPLSAQNRGRANPVVIEVAGLSSHAQAATVARDMAQRTARVHRQITLQCRLDPKVEPYDIALWRGDPLLVDSIAITMTSGEDMALVLRESLTRGEGA